MLIIRFRSTHIPPDTAHACRYNRLLPALPLTFIIVETTFSKYWKPVYQALRPLPNRQITTRNDSVNSRTIKTPPQQDGHLRV
jgi:hypothetical protein